MARGRKYKVKIIWGNHQKRETRGKLRQLCSHRTGFVKQEHSVETEERECRPNDG